MLPGGEFQMRKRLLTVDVASQYRTPKHFLKPMRCLFIDNITLLIYLIKMAKSSDTLAKGGNWISFQNFHVINSLDFLLHLRYRNMHRYNCTHNYMYIYSLLILYVQFHAALMQTTFRCSCPPLWNVDRAVLEECNIKSYIKYHGFNSKKLMNTVIITANFLCSYLCTDVTLSN